MGCRLTAISYITCSAKSLTDMAVRISSFSVILSTIQLMESLLQALSDEHAQRNTKNYWGL